MGRDLAKALSFCFFFAVVGRRCVFLFVGDNFIFLVISDWVGSLFLFLAWSVDIGLSVRGWACWVIVQQFELARFRPIWIEFGPRRVISLV